MSIAPRPIRRLLLSIHDVGPRSESATDRLHDLLARFGDAGKIALLVVPNHWGEAPIHPGSAYASRLRGWAESGADIFLHGWFHRDPTAHQSRFDRIRAQHMTAGEGEFLGLDRKSAGTLMRDGKALLEDISGRPLAGFIAPAWLYGPGALAALADCGFALAEDHMKIWQPTTGRVIARSPVLTWASRSRGRIASSLLAARILPPALRWARVARIGVHPGDVTVPAIMTSIDRAVGTLSQSHQISRYSDLIGGA
ncbi:MAG: DUF2334 domain-containing protein [Sphingobium sp.]|nr:DUF2334 domain-containing protein [Sphingobium sp.]